MKIKIIVDNRERKLIPLIKSLNNDYGYNYEIVIDKLDIGDIIIKKDDEEIMIIERKSYNDLAGSLRDGRYQEQSFRLNSVNLHNHNIVYLIEGDRDKYSNRYSKVPFSTLLVTMFCIQYYKGFCVFQTRNLVETAEYILRMSNKISREKKREGYYLKNENSNMKEKSYSDVIKREKKSNITPENIGEIILSQIPGISSKSSKAIMSHFESLHDMLLKLKKDKHCLDNIELTTSNGSKRRISQSVKNNVIKYLLYQKNEPEIFIET